MDSVTKSQCVRGGRYRSARIYIGSHPHYMKARSPSLSSKGLTSFNRLGHVPKVQPANLAKHRYGWSKSIIGLAPQMSNREGVEVGELNGRSHCGWENTPLLIVVFRRFVSLGHTLGLKNRRFAPEYLNALLVLDPELHLHH